jgi:PAS domain S-box-containing protein
MAISHGGRTGLPPLRQDATELKLLVDALADYSICMLDKDGIITGWNAGAERIRGYTAAEVVGQPFALLFGGRRKDSLPERMLREAAAAGRHESEGWRPRRDGSRFYASDIVQAIRGADGAIIGFGEIMRDITERVAAEEALRQSERRFRMLVEGVVDYAICMLEPDGVVSNWNTGAERLKGYTAEEIIGEHFSRFYTEEDRAAGLPGRVLEIAAREGRYEAEGWRVRKDGSRFWASVVVDAIRGPSGLLDGFAKVTRDVTERRAAQEALRQSERQLRLLIAAVTDYAIFMLDPRGVVVSWNAGAQRIKGYAAEEIVGQHFSRFYTEADRAAGVPARALRTAAEQERFEAEGWRVRKDGTTFFANVVLTAIREEGGLVGFAKITRDITQRREAAIALQEAQAQRAHALKMEALGQLTGGVAHDFNNLLMVVSGHVQTIKKRLGNDAKAARAARAIELAAERGATLTRQLLTFSRRQPLQPVAVEIGERVEAFLTMLASAISESVRLVTRIPAGVWRVRVDAGELELALVNIALNARDAMPSGGTITVSAENVTFAPGRGGDGIEGDFVALRVSDTGSGIAADVLPKVFDPFSTASRTKAPPSPSSCPARARTRTHRSPRRRRRRPAAAASSSSRTTARSPRSLPRCWRISATTSSRSRMRRLPSRRPAAGNSTSW